MSTLPPTFLTPEQYLEIERKAEYKSEYYQGEMFAIAGVPEAHNLLVVNLILILGQQLFERPCQLYPSDMRVMTPAGLYTYPDVSAVCVEPRFADHSFDILLNPALIVEVLSPSTEAYDRGRKAEQYRAIESLTDYLLVASDRIHVELLTRQEGGSWLMREFSRPDESIELQSIDCRIALATLYRKIDLS